MQKFVQFLAGLMANLWPGDVWHHALQRGGFVRRMVWGVGFLLRLCVLPGGYAQRHHKTVGASLLAMASEM